MQAAIDAMTRVLPRSLAQQFYPLFSCLFLDQHRYFHWSIPFLNVLRVTLPAGSIQLLADHWYRGNLALEWGEFGIRCNCVAPGPIADTPGLEKLSVLVAHSRTLDVWNMYPH